MAKQTISAIYAPYNFVPLHEKVFVPAWAEEVSHDRPFQDGLCGELELVITALTPILVGNEREVRSDGSGEVHFHKAPDGRYMIPGSSLRGMVRNVLEIVSFGRMRLVDDRKFGLRDLGGGLKNVYRKAIQPNRIRAGWMRFVRGKWVITPCTWVRVHHQELEDFARRHGKQLNLGGREPQVGKRYHAWAVEASLPLQVRFSLRGKSACNLGEGPYEGEIVFTGQPSPKKKREFVFYKPRPQEAFTLTDEEIADFRQVYGDEQNENNPWKYWRPRFERGEKVPVFFTDYQGRRAVGLSMMFRIAYRHSIHDAVRHVSPEHLAERGDDLPALIFGFADANEGKASLKGRAWFAPAFAEGSPREREIPPVVLNAPKPSFYPSYMEQPQSAPGKLAGNRYTTLMDEDCRIRGFKRYPARFKAQPQPPEDPNSKKVQTHLFPLDAGTRFRTRLVFHNLKPEELGALVWVLTWGKNKDLRHSLGMGKPFGFGQVRVEIVGHEIRPNDPQMKTPSLDDCMHRFEAMMARWNPNWRRSRQLRNLLAMADPARAAHAPGGKLAYMRLAQFRAAKNARLVLADYAEATGMTGAVSFRTASSQGAAKSQAVASQVQGEPLSAEERLEETTGEVIKVESGRVLVRLADGKLAWRRRNAIQGVNPSDIRPGMHLHLRGKGAWVIE